MLPVTDLLLHGQSRPKTPTLILLHFYGGSRREWIETSLLLGTKFRVVSIDTPGFGDAAEIAGYSVEEMAAQFRDTLGRLALERFVLVGHSMTGKVAAVLASRGLPGLEKLVLVAPSPPCPEPIAPENRAKMLAQTHPTQADAEQYVLSNSVLPLAPDVLERAVEDRLKANPDAWRAWMESGSREDWSGRVGVVAVPTLVIAAERDSSLGPAVQREMTVPHFADVRLRVIAEAGHLLPMETPDKLAALVEDFVCDQLYS